MMDKRLLRLVPGSMRYVMAAVLWKWVDLAGNVALIFSICNLIQALVAQTQLPIVSTAVLCLASLVLKVLSSKLQANASFKASQDVKGKLRHQIYEKVLRLGPAYTERTTTGEVVQLAVEGCEQLETYFGQYLPQLFYSVLAPLTLFFIVFPISWAAALVLLVCVPLIPIVIIVVQKITKRILSRYWDEYTGLADNFLENLQGLTTLKIYMADKARHEEMNAESEHFRVITMKVLRMQLNSIIVMDIVALGGAAAGIAVSLSGLASGSLDLFGCLFIILVSSDFFVPMRRLGSYFHVAMNGIAASDKIFKLLAIEEPEQKTLEMHDEDAIAMRNVCFGYEAEREVLHSVSLEIPEKGLVAIVGESGSGKSTIATLLTGGAENYAGSIDIGEKQVRDVSGSSLAKHITRVSSGSYLFSGTIRDNLMMGNPNASDKEMWAALDKAALSEFARAKHGLDTKIGNQAENLSGGQRQRLALARALLHNSPVYIFDEATSNIDVESENRIMEVIHQISSMSSVLIISHRLANVVDADNIYVIDKGRIVGSGKHDELLNTSSIYRNLWESQQMLESYSKSKEACYE